MSEDSRTSAKPKRPFVVHNPSDDDAPRPNIPHNPYKPPAIPYYSPENQSPPNTPGSSYHRHDTVPYPRGPIGGRPLPRKRVERSPQDLVIPTAPDKVIFVTKDSERYATVDLLNVRSAAQLRELILNKLQIFHEDENHPYLIYQTEIGAYAMGEPLSDSSLLAMCREQADSKGSLKFLVTHSFAPVHEPPPPSHSLDYRQPQTHLVQPLRPRRQSRSRNGSLSSSSENIITAENSAGYDADIDNNPDRDLSTKASPPKPTHIPPSPPRRTSNHGRSNSPEFPNSPPSKDRRNGRKEDRIGGHTLPPIPQVAPPVPPLSPHRPDFPSHDDLSTSLSVPHRHVRSGSDADRDSSNRFADHRVRPQNYASLQQLRPQPSRENMWLQAGRWFEDDEYQEIVVPQVPRARDEHSPTIRKGPPRPSGFSSSRPLSPYTTRSHITPTPPTRPAPGIPIGAAKKGQRNLPISSTQPINSGFIYNAVPSPHKHSPISSSVFPGNLSKAKSVDNLKLLSARRNPPPTPQLPMMSSRDTPISHSPSSTFSSMPKSYELPRRPLPPTRILPTGNVPDVPQGSSSHYSSSSRGYPSNFISPSYEPYPRPQSAADDAISPTRSFPQLQSPTMFSSNLDSGEHNRSPRTVSPNRSYHSPGFMTGPRPRPTTTTNSDRSSEPSGPENSSSPPLTPQDQLADERGYVEPSPPLSPRGIIDKDSSGSELTLKEDGQKYFAKLLNGTTPPGTYVAPSATQQTRSGRRLTPSPPPSERRNSTDSFTFECEYDEEDGSYIGSGTWIVKPEAAKSAARPLLMVQIDPASSSSSSSAKPEVPPKDAPLSRQPAVVASNPNLLRVQARRPESTFIDPDSDNWAPRPPPENIYEELEKFFPKHDLDKPVIEATSGETSPTNAEPVAALPPVPIPEERGTRIRAKKSIRIVAQEHKKRIDRTSNAVDAIAQKDMMMRKRSTKLWGSRLEEVTTAQARNNSTTSLPESPSGGPTTFKWVRGELIGKGTYGRVYLALNATTGEMIAVKQVELPQTASDKNDSRHHTVVQALKMESETLRDLDHPHIVQYLGFEETPANLSIFLEYVPGGSVGSCLHKHGKFADNVTRSFTAQILSGLEYLHSKGILHRDMKADNILVEMSGICKISDFGISKRTDDLQGGAHTAMKGTVFWMAPEVVNSQKKGYNFKIDIWSVGCVVLEMWAGMRPWMGEEMIAVMFKLYQSKQPPPVPEDVVLGEDADDFRRKCFAINPEERPSAMELRKHPYLTLPPGWTFTGFT